MAGILKSFVDMEVREQIEKLYPHIQTVASVYAKITKVNEQIGYYKYALRILDKNREPDRRFPEIPGVKSDLELQIGDTVVVTFMYGDTPYIVGRVVA